MPPPRIAEALQIIEHIGLGLSSRTVHLLAVRSVFSEKKKLSITASSQMLPAPFMLQVTLWSARRRWNGTLVYWLPRSGQRPLRESFHGSYASQHRYHGCGCSTRSTALCFGLLFAVLR